jgi:hypothetical protein
MTPNGFVYFIGCGDYVKIGFSRKPDVRIDTLSTANPVNVAVLAVFPGSRAHEAQIHHRFEEFRHRGEWFRRSAPIEDVIANGLPPFEQPCPKQRFYWHPLALFIERRGMTQRKFAAQIGCKESHLSLILKGKRGVSFKLAKHISNATGGEIPIESLPHEVAA